MSENQLQAQQLPLPLADNSVVAQKIALARGMLAQKSRMMLAVILGVFAMLTLVVTSFWTDELNINDAMLAGALALAYFLGTRVMLRSDEQRLYGLLFWWVTGTLIVILALLFNALHGPRLLIASDSSFPYVLGYVPVAILFIHAYLLPITAWRLTLVFVAIASAITLSSMWLQSGSGGVSSGTIWALVCVTLLPVHTALLAYLNHNNHSEILRAIILESQRLQEQSQSLADAENTDSVTGGLNESGVRRQLKSDLSLYSDVPVAMLQVRTVRDVKHAPGSELYSQSLLRTASHVSNLFGEDTCWGRIRDNVFVLWKPGVDEAQMQECLHRMPAAFAVAAAIDYSITGLADVKGANSVNPEFDLLVEAENRLFLKAMH